MNCCLSILKFSNPSNFTKFTDAPIIVGRKVVRDHLNLQLAKKFAKRTGKEFALYHSVKQGHWLNTRETVVT